MVLSNHGNLGMAIHDPVNTEGAIYEVGLNLIPAGISNLMPSEMWDELTYSFQNFNGRTLEVGNGRIISCHTSWWM